MIATVFKIQNIIIVISAIILVTVTSLVTVIAFISTLIVFTLPGIPLTHKYCSELPSVNKIYFAMLLGIPISSSLCAVIGCIAGFNPLLFILAIVAAAVCLSQFDSERYNIIDLSHKADSYYFIGLLIVLLMLSYSFTNFGKVNSSGFMFNDLYATDLLHHMSVFRHLPKGLPPSNPYFNGTGWHYYWLSHMLPATAYSLSGSTVYAKQIMYLTLCLNTILFYNVLVTLICTYYNKRTTIIILLLLSLFAYGYNDIYNLFKYSITFLPSEIKNITGINYFIDDSYGGSFSGYSHGWFRNLLVEPHSTLALALTFLFISLNANNSYEKKSFNFFMGTLLAFIFSFDAFIGAVIMCWAFIETITSRFNSKPLCKNMSSVVLTFLPVVIMLVFLYFLGIISPGSSGLIFKPFTKMLVLSPLYFLIDYGPQIIFAVIGSLLLRKNQKLLDELSPFIRLFGIAVFFMFFINLSDIGSTQMFRKSGMIVRIPMIILSGVFLDTILKWRIRQSGALIATCIILAIPTPFMDIYKLGVVSNSSSSILVKNEDIAACAWIRNNLPADAVIQDYPGGSTPIVAFGERRVSLGDWEHAKSSGVPPWKIKIRMDKIKEIFSSRDSFSAYKTSEELNIGYIYINERCWNTFLSGPIKFKESNFFEEVYHTDGVTIYKLTKSSLTLQKYSLAKS